MLPVLLAILLSGSSFHRKLFAGKGGNTCADEDFSARQIHLKSLTDHENINKHISTLLFIKCLQKHIHTYSHMRARAHTVYVCVCVCVLYMYVQSYINTYIYRYQNVHIYKKMYTGINKYKPHTQTLIETEFHNIQDTLSSGEYYIDCKHPNNSETSGNLSLTYTPKH